MANEARILNSLRISSGNLEYQSEPSTFNADITTAKGPSPGAFEASTTGTNVDLDALTTPALYRITNLDTTNYVELGLYIDDDFYPFHEVLPGEFYIGRFSRNLGDPTGTPTTGVLRVQANTANCNVVVEAFET